MRKLIEIDFVCKLGNSQIPPLQDLTGHLRFLRQGFIHQFQLAPTLPGDHFIHLVGTVHREQSQIYIQECSVVRNVVTVTVKTVESDHDVEIVSLTNNLLDIGYFVVDFLEKPALSFFHLPAERCIR